MVGFRHPLNWFALSTFLLLQPVAGAAVPDRVEFNRDVRPILADNCYACHGPDSGKREADLRLDQESAAVADRGGYRALVPGKPDESELFLRVISQDMPMPPRKTGKSLKPEQIEILKRWIEQGGKYEKHWSLLPPKRPAVPAVKDGAWPANEIDRFLLARMEREGVTPSPEAEPRVLARRLYFDLLGLPPTPEEVEEFVAAWNAGPGRSPTARSEALKGLVEKLLGSPHYGERMAIYWLDLVRYADTNGYHGDNHHDIALYRDWVIKAFNDNMPFDRFTTEQLAGDLLPGSTVEQKIASGYNRLNMVTREGGAQPKEYIAKYAADRVRNVSSVWMGMTLGCCECHDHKFDALTQKDFYSLAAFFADIQETPVGVQPPFLVPTPEQEARLEALDRELARLAEAAKSAPKEEQEAIGKEQARVQKERNALVNRIDKTLVSVSVQPRVVRILPRGNWLDESGPVVQPDTPASLPPLGVKGRRATRLDLAKWLTARENPLVARVFVNRLWKLFFGRGLVTTLEDLGTQGVLPTHPDLLDWLALEFIDSGWDVKHMVRLMVLSSAYRQSSVATPERRARDPYNALVARQARYRMEAEVLRDNALAVSGLLVRKVGGKSVKPYQPEGYWIHLNFPKRTWVHDKNADQYRRGLYTYWCRTFLHPAMHAFDAPTREECCVERPRSNTPLQALVLLNDPSYVEAARAFAERVLREGGTTLPDRIQFAYREVLNRQALPEEVEVLTRLHEKHLAHYRENPAAAQELLTIGERPFAKDVPAEELAAWTSVARVLLNLHETITRS